MFFGYSFWFSTKVTLGALSWLQHITKAQSPSLYARSSKVVVYQCREPICALSPKRLATVYCLCNVLSGKRLLSRWLIDWGGSVFVKKIRWMNYIWFIIMGVFKSVTELLIAHRNEYRQLWQQCCFADVKANYTLRQCLVYFLHKNDLTRSVQEILHT